MRHVTPLTCPAWTSKGCVCPEQDAFINERRSGTDRRAQLAEVVAPDLGTEKLLRDMLDRAYKMMQMAGYKVAVQDSDNNNPIVAWMSDARHVLYGNGPTPSLDGPEQPK